MFRGEFTTLFLDVSTRFMIAGTQCLTHAPVRSALSQYDLTLSLFGWYRFREAAYRSHTS